MKNLEVKKSQNLINSSFKLNSLSLKLVTTLISVVQEENKNNEYTINTSNFKELFGIKSNKYIELIEKSINEILSKQSAIKYTIDNKVHIGYWVYNISYDAGQISFKLNDNLLPFILDLKEKYLKYNLKNILTLKSEYSIRIYEILKDEYNLKSRYSSKAVELELKIDTMREMFLIPKDSYQNFKDFRVRIIEKAQKDLLEHTDIKFLWKTKKTGRKVTSISFEIYPNEKNIQEEKPKATKFMDYVNQLRDLYKDTSKYFIFSNFQLEKKEKQVYFFGINKDNKMFAMPQKMGYSEKINKEQSQIIYNASYLCYQYSKLYKNAIDNRIDLFEMSQNFDKLVEFVEIQKEIVRVLSEHNPRENPIN
jgi:plasmid replication initiation protein